MIARSRISVVLLCVDSRFALWGEGAIAGAKDDWRRFASGTSEDEIERAIQENEKNLRKNFLGMEVAERQIWPWL